jgi:hypothetical protein
MPEMPTAAENSLPRVRQFPSSHLLWLRTQMVGGGGGGKKGYIKAGSLDSMAFCLFYYVWYLEETLCNNTSHIGLYFNKASCKFRNLT